MDRNAVRYEIMLLTFGRARIIETDGHEVFRAW